VASLHSSEDLGHFEEVEATATDWVGVSSEMVCFFFSPMGNVINGNIYGKKTIRIIMGQIYGKPYL
jgi:hypothetical protein